MAWEILEAEAASAEENMRRDVELLENINGRTWPILHLYTWQRPSVTYGYFIRPGEVLNLQEVERRGIDIARRPTGGGVVFHLWDLAFSVLVPAKSPLYSSNTLSNYQLINRVIQDIAKEWLGAQSKIDLTTIDSPFSAQECTHFCMARPTKYDVILQGKKIAGAAQRKTKDGFLHQGTIALLPPQEEVLSAVLPSHAVRAAMVQHTCPLLPSDGNLEQGRLRLRKLLKQHFSQL